MKKIKGMDYTLTLGAFIMFFGGLGILFNDIFSRLEYKLIGVLIIAILLYSLSYLFKKILKLDISYKVSFILGNLALTCSYFSAGYNNLFGNWFSIYGDGCQLFLASVAFLVTILSILTKIFLKNANHLYITFISLLVMIFHLLNYSNIDYQISLIVVGSILLILNFCRFSKILYQFTNIAIYVFSILCVIFGFEGSFFYSFILVSINVIALINLLYKYKTVESELLSILIVFYTLIRFAFISYNLFNIGLVTVILSFLICILDLCNNAFQVIDNKLVKIIYKLISLSFLIFIIIKCNSFASSALISAIFIILSSIVNSYILKHNDYENYFLPFKVCLAFSCIYSFISYYINNFNSIYIYSILSILLVLIYNLISDKKIRIIYLIINLVLLFIMCSFMTFELLEFIFIISSLLFSYIGLKSEDYIVPSSILYTYIIMIIFSFAFNNLIGFAHSVVLLTAIGILAFVNRNKKYNFALSILMFMLVINSFINIILSDIYFIRIVESIIYFLIIGITSEVLFDKDKYKNIFMAITICLMFVDLISINEFIINIYVLVASVIFLLIGIKLDNRKVLYYIGLIFGILSIICLLQYLNGIPLAIYFIIISCVLISIVSIMVYKFNKKIENVKKCSICNEEVSINDKFCFKCGNKLK